MTGDLLCITSDVIDPETGDVIGQYPNLRLKVTEVYPRFCVAETYRLVRGDDNNRVVTVNLSGTNLQVVGAYAVPGSARRGFSITRPSFRLGGSQYRFTLNARRSNPRGARQ